MKLLRNFIFIAVAVVLIVLFFSFNTISRTFLDYLWFHSLNQEDVWWQFIWFRTTFYLIGGLIAAALYVLSYLFARMQLGGWLSSPFPSTATRLLLGVALFLAFFLHGPTLQSMWQSLVYYLHAPDTGVTDPLYGLDVSFYMFRLKWYDSLLAFSQILLFFLAVYSAVPYVIAAQGVNPVKDRQRFYKLVQLAVRHLAVIGGLFFLTLAFNSLLARYSMVYDGSSSVVAGASYVDVYAKKLAHTLFFYLGIGISLIIIGSGFLNRWLLSAIGAASWIILYAVVLQIFPWAVSTLKVKPNEFTAEKQFIEWSVKYTRQAYGLDDLSRRPFEVSGKLRASDFRKDSGIIENIRLWDYRPTRATFKQLQEIRLYYEFLDVDVDRYNVNGKKRQVLLSARELNQEELPDQARTWIPRHLQYTHGYGVTMAPANRVTPEGLPELWIKDFPPETMVQGLPVVKTPGIYYGEMTDNYVLVKTSMSEFDYPQEQNFAESRYEGEGGIQLGSGIRKLLISWQFDTWKFLISSYIKPETRLLFRRNIHLAVRMLAPFLRFDSDPYIVVGEDGRLYWIMDAYTMSDRYPYSQRFDSRFLASFPDRPSSYEFDNINYIRNPVKVVIDAYNGNMDFYVVDESDPVIQVWKSFLPGLFKDVSTMPDFILDHLRYPETLFLIQSGIYRDYHMDEARTFYNREDRWQISQEVYSGNQQLVEPYYTMIRLPGEKVEEYMLMIPFIPNNKQNLVAWMAARCDYSDLKNAGSAGKKSRMMVFDFPRTRQVYGTLQIESRIDQDPDISKDLTLWNQQGSRVIRGNLLVIPVNQTLLYVEPIYLQSTKSPFPELRRVIAADSSSVVMEESLEAALSALTGESVSSSYTSASSTGDGKNQTNISDGSSARAGEAQRLLEKAREAAGAGDWVKFGDNMEKLEKLLGRMSGE